MKRIFVTISFCFLFLLSSCNSKPKFYLKDAYFFYEYGETVSLDPEYYLAEDTDKEIIENAILKINDLEKEDGKEFTKPGNYKGSITYDGFVRDFSIYVDVE